MKQTIKLLFLLLLGFFLQPHAAFAVIATSSTAPTTVNQTVEKQDNGSLGRANMEQTKTKSFVKRTWQAIKQRIDKSTKTGKYLWFTIVFWGLAIATNIVFATLPTGIVASIVGVLTVIFYIAGIITCIKWLAYLISD